MLFPVLLHYLFAEKKNRVNYIFFLLLVIIFAVAIVLSYTRAAWISLFVALGVYLLIYFRIRLRTIFLGIATLVGIVVLFQKQIKIF
jgi:O-antigen ligase